MAIAALAASGASASPGLGNETSHRIAALNVANTSVFFEVEYNAEGYYGPVKCRGHHQTNAKLGYPGNATEGGRDVETCKSTTGLPLIGLAPLETVALGTGWFPNSSGWASDYDGQGASAIEYKVNATAKSFKLKAYYPFAG